MMLASFFFFFFKWVQIAKLVSMGCELLYASASEVAIKRNNTRIPALADKLCEHCTCKNSNMLADICIG